MTDETMTEGPSPEPATAASETPAPETAAPVADTPPDRMSVNPRSPWFGGEILGRGVGIRLNGQEKRGVEEYCVSEGWVRIAAGRSLDRKGNPMTIRLNGTVEPYFEDVAADGQGTTPAA